MLYDPSFATQTANGDRAEPYALAAGDGAITQKSGHVHVTKASIAALTIAAPTAGTDDGKELHIISETAFAHVVTSGADGFNGKGSSGTATFGAAAGNSVKLLARNGHWWIGSLNGVTIA